MLSPAYIPTMSNHDHHLTRSNKGGLVKKKKKKDNKLHTMIVGCLNELSVCSAALSLHLMFLRLTQTLQSQDMMTGTKCLVQTGSEPVFVCGWQAK